MKLFNENIEKLQEIFFYGKYRLERTYKPNEALYLYDFVTKLKDIIGTDIKIEKSMAIAVGLYKRNQYLKDSYKNFIASPDWLKELLNFMKINLESLLKSNDLKAFEDTISINEYYMVGNILDYYEKFSDASRGYLFLRMKDKIYDYNDSNKHTHIFDDVYGQNVIFVKNNNDISTMANIIYELEHIFKKYNLSMINSKAINEYVYYNSFNEVEALIFKNRFLSYLSEKHPDLYKEGVKKAYIKDYIYILNCFDEISVDNVETKDYVHFNESLNYIYGELLSSIYLSLDDVNREIFSNFLNVRSNKMLGKDIFDILLKLTGRQNYIELAEVASDQIKRNIK